MSIKDKFIVKSIKKDQCNEWLLNKHYARRMCPIKYSLGLFDNIRLVGIIVIGKPASNNVCKSICGEKYRDDVYELKRLVLNETLPSNIGSYFISKSLRLLPPMILVSYADPEHGHNGYIYQASNFLYLGKGKPRTHMVGKNGGHPRTYKKGELDRVAWIPKHRYVYFNGNRTMRKHWRKALKHTIKPYPKGDNKKYNASYCPSVQYELF